MAFALSGTVNVPEPDDKVTKDVASNALKINL
jgi:hypothetical protein